MPTRNAADYIDAVTDIDMNNAPDIGWLEESAV